MLMAIDHALSKVFTEGRRMLGVIMKPQRLVEYDCYFCDVCREYVYNEFRGEPKQGIFPLTRVDILPSSWRCPLCGASKDKLRASTLLDDYELEESSSEVIDTVAKSAIT